MLALGPATQQTSLCDVRSRESHRDHRRDGSWKVVGGRLAGHPALPKSVHIHGDMFRRMVVNGRADMTPNPSADAIAQLNLRYDLAAQTADRFAEEGFDAIVQDVILGKDLVDFVKRIASHERYLVVLSPASSALEWQEEQRTKAGYVHLFSRSPGRGAAAGDFPHRLLA